MTITYDNDALGTLTAPDTVVLERMLPGPIERVWEFLVDSDKRRTWLGGGEFELKKDGAGEIRFHHSEITDDEPLEKYREVHEVGIAFPVRIIECEPPHLLTITWPDENGHDSHVSFALVRDHEMVRLTLTHGRIADLATMVDVSGGWHSHMAVLLARLEGRRAPPFWSRLPAIEEAYRARFAG